MRSIPYKWNSDTKGRVDMSTDGDVRSLRSKVSEELGLPASQGLRLKCGHRDLRDSDPISAVDATVQAMLRGGLAGGTALQLMPDSEDESYDRSDDERAADAAAVGPSAPVTKRRRLAPRPSSGNESNSGAGGSEAEAVEAEAAGGVSEAEEDEGESEGEGASDEDEAAEAEAEAEAETPWGYPYALCGHGHPRLAELEELLSHDVWEPTPERNALWAELEDLLGKHPELRTYLVPPEEHAAGLPSPPPYGPVPNNPLLNSWLKPSHARVAELKRKNTASNLKIAKLQGKLAKAKRKLVEAGVEEEELEEDADDDVHQRRDYLPFEQDVINMIVEEPGSRSIHWIYSREGNLGKTRLADELITLFDALRIDPGAAKGALELIGKQKEKSATFVSKPVLLLDLPRSEPVAAKKLYKVLEVIQGSFSDRNDTIQWMNLPHVIVFANERPETQRLSADRLRVRLITMKHELVRHRYVDKLLEKERERQRLEQEQEEEAARTGEPPPRELERRARGTSGAGSSSSSSVDGFHVPALRARTLFQSLTYPYSNPEP